MIPKFVGFFDEPSMTRGVIALGVRGGVEMVQDSGTRASNTTLEVSFCMVMVDRARRQAHDHETGMHTNQ